MKNNSCWVEASDRYLWKTLEANWSYQAPLNHSGKIGHSFNSCTNHLSFLPSSCCAFPLPFSPFSSLFFLSPYILPFPSVLNLSPFHSFFLSFSFAFSYFFGLNFLFASFNMFLHSHVILFFLFLFPLCYHLQYTYIFVFFLSLVLPPSLWFFKHLFPYFFLFLYCLLSLIFLLGLFVHLCLLLASVPAPLSTLGKAVPEPTICWTTAVLPTAQSPTTTTFPLITEFILSS